MNGTKLPLEQKVYEPKVWNSLPSHIETSENLIHFKVQWKIGMAFSAVAQFAQSKLYISFICLLSI